MTTKRTRRAAITAFVSACLVGCGYSVRPPYDPEIKTVYVPVFRSRTFRRDVNLMLTEEVIKEIERRTTFKVVGTQAEADTTLDGEINFTDKNLILPNPFNLPRQLTATLTANVRWTDNHTQKVVGKSPQNQQPGMVVTTVYNFFPEIGETSQAAFLRSCQWMAKEIVGAMEEKW